MLPPTYLSACKTSFYKLPISTEIGCKIRPYTPKSNITAARYSIPMLRAGIPAAHSDNRLMLLGSPPDMVHSSELRRTRSSTHKYRLRPRRISPRSGNAPPLSGSRVQGTANSPAGMALFHSRSLKQVFFYYYIKKSGKLQYPFVFFLEYRFSF